MACQRHPRGPAVDISPTQHTPSSSSHLHISSPLRQPPFTLRENQPRPALSCPSATIVLALAQRRFSMFLDAQTTSRPITPLCDEHPPAHPRKHHLLRLLVIDVYDGVGYHPLFLDKRALQHGPSPRTLMWPTLLDVKWPAGSAHTAHDVSTVTS